jgi:predicted DCC family thiol-disulfide oxidoreductase YuxK
MAANPIILFDGVCNLCIATVHWIIARDRAATFRFAPLQSAVGRQVLAAAHAPANLPDGIVLIEGSRVLTRSDAAIDIARRLGFPWSLAATARLLPRSARDGLYAWVAAHRHRWFGKQNACLVPTSKVRSRFLHGHEPPEDESRAP